MVYAQLRAVWCTVGFNKINFNGRRAVMKFAKYNIGSCYHIGGVARVKYIGHVIANDMTDDADMMRQIRQL